LALEAILVSPDFLFHVERDPKTSVPGAGSSHPLSDHEFAARLSYFLWASMPDEGLSRLADQGRLHNREVLDQQVRRMMADPKASNLVENFAAQWLQLRNLGRRKTGACWISWARRSPASTACWPGTMGFRTCRARSSVE